MFFLYAHRKGTPMKKVFLCLLVVFVLLLQGCSASPVKEREAGEEKAEERGLWYLEPSIRSDEVIILRTYSEPLVFPSDIEKLGYPQEWDYSQDYAPFNFLGKKFYGAPAYSPDSVLLRTEDTDVIMTYEGKVLAKQKSEYYQYEYMPTGGLFAGYLNDDTSFYLDNFNSIVIKPMLDGLCGGPLGLFVYNEQLRTDIINKEPTDTGIGCEINYVAWEGGSVDIEKDFKNRQVTSDDLYGRRSTAPKYGRYITEYFTEDYYLFDEFGVKTGEIHFDKPTFIDDFTNGFLLIDGNMGDYTWKKGFYDFEKQEYITELEYDDVHPFVEGFASVKKEEKWAFINDKGETVTDFLWDSVSTPYDGKVFVAKDGYIGVLNLKWAIDNNMEITLESCYGSTDEEECRKKLEKSTAYNLNVADDGAIGEITYNVKNVNVRTSPEKAGRKIGINVPGATYRVYEIKEADGYTWYRISSDSWIANDGKWGDYVSFN